MPNRSTRADSTPALAATAQFRGTAKSISPAILLLGALLAILTAIVPAWSQTKFDITNASGSSNVERCLTFGSGRFSLRGFNNTVPLTFR